MATPNFELFQPKIPNPPAAAPRPGDGKAARRLGVLPVPSLEWNPQVEKETAHLPPAPKPETKQ